MSGNMSKLEKLHPRSRTYLPTSQLIKFATSKEYSIGETHETISNKKSFIFQLKINMFKITPIKAP